MIDWNVVVTVFDERGFRLAKRLLAEFAPVYTTDFFNVLVMKVPDVAAFTDQVHRLFEETPGYLIHNSSHILNREDADAAAIVQNRFQSPVRQSHSKARSW